MHFLIAFFLCYLLLNTRNATGSNWSNNRNPKALLAPLVVQSLENSAFYNKVWIYNNQNHCKITFANDNNVRFQTVADYLDLIVHLHSVEFADSEGELCYPISLEELMACVVSKRSTHLLDIYNSKLVYTCNCGIRFEGYFNVRDVYDAAIQQGVEFDQDSCIKSIVSLINVIDELPFKQNMPNLFMRLVASANSVANKIDLRSYLDLMIFETRPEDLNRIAQLFDVATHRNAQNILLDLLFGDKKLLYSFINMNSYVKILPFIVRLINECKLQNIQKIQNQLKNYFKSTWYSMKEDDLYWIYLIHAFPGSNFYMKINPWSISFHDSRLQQLLLDNNLKYIYDLCNKENSFPAISENPFVLSIDELADKYLKTNVNTGECTLDIQIRTYADMTVFYTLLTGKCDTITSIHFSGIEFRFKDFFERMLLAIPAVIKLQRIVLSFVESEEAICQLLNVLPDSLTEVCFSFIDNVSILSNILALLRRPNIKKASLHGIAIFSDKNFVNFLSAKSFQSLILGGLMIGESFFQKAIAVFKQIGKTKDKYRVENVSFINKEKLIRGSLFYDFTENYCIFNRMQPRLNDDIPLLAFQDFNPKEERGFLNLSWIPLTFDNLQQIIPLIGKNLKGITLNKVCYKYHNEQSIKKILIKKFPKLISINFE